MLDIKFDPWAPEFLGDPYPVYAELRREHPCWHIPDSDLWVVTRYDDVRAIDRDYRRFSCAEGVGVRRESSNILMGADPPTHTVTRRFLQPMFHRNVMVDWEERARVIVDELLDTALEAGTVEWRSHFAMTLPLKVTGELLGIPTDPEMMDTYVSWSRPTLDNIDVREGHPRLPEIQAAMGEAMQWFIDFARTRRAEQRPEPLDMIDQMMGAGEHGHYSDEDVALLALSVLAAGNQTTADLLCHTFAVMAENPDQWELLRESPERAAGAVDELLRYEPPTQGLWRTTLEDVEIAGCAVPRNDRVLIYYGSANRDEEKWSDPNAFDITRNARDHLGFGIGVHRCLGEPLAKLEGIAALEGIARRVKSFEFTEPYERNNNSVVRGFNRMPVALTAS